VTWLATRSSPKEEMCGAQGVTSCICEIFSGSAMFMIRRSRRSCSGVEVRRLRTADHISSKV